MKSHEKKIVISFLSGLIFFNYFRQKEGGQGVLKLFCQINIFQLAVNFFD